MVLALVGDFSTTEMFEFAGLDAESILRLILAALLIAFSIWLFSSSTSFFGRAAHDCMKNAVKGSDAGPNIVMMFIALAGFSLIMSFILMLVAATAGIWSASG
jgi:hypothetical protein